VRRAHAVVVFWCAVLALPFCGARVWAQGVSARATVDSTHYLIGDAIPVHIRITHPASVAFQSLFADTIGGFTVLARPAFHQEGETTSVGDVVVARYDSGRAVLPPLTFFYSGPGDSGTRTVETNEIFLSIQTVPVDTSKEFKDLKPPIGIPLPWWEVALYVGGALLLVTLGYLLYRWRKNRPVPMPGEAPSAPRRPAHVIAFEELASLKEKKLWQQGLIKQYYTEVTDIARRYLENRYQTMALERTTDEILDDLRRLRMPDELARKTESLLRRADLVKFAKHQPVVMEHEESLQAVYDFVERTKIVEQPAVSPVGGKSDVGS
jgi:hypothetical protein